MVLVLGVGESWACWRHKEGEGNCSFVPARVFAYLRAVQVASMGQPLI